MIFTQDSGNLVRERCPAISQHSLCHGMVFSKTRVEFETHLGILINQLLSSNL